MALVMFLEEEFVRKIIGGKSELAGHPEDRHSAAADGLAEGGRAGQEPRGSEQQGARKTECGAHPEDQHAAYTHHFPPAYATKSQKNNYGAGIILPARDCMAIPGPSGFPFDISSSVSERRVQR